MLILICISFLIILAMYCYFEKLENFWTATALKVTLSAYIAAVALISAFSLNTLTAFLIAIGLCFAVPADFFLQYIKTNLKKYRFGIFFFGAMHVSLLFSFYIKYGISYWEFIILACFIGILLYFQKSEKWKMGKEKNQLTVYTVLVTLMAAKAISIFIIAPSLPTLFLGIGGLFFFCSDLFLGIWDYYKNKFIFLLLNRVIYFIGQLSIAFYLLLSL